MLQEWYLPQVLGSACRTAAGVACLNRAEAEYLKSRRWVTDAKVHVLAHGVPPDFFVSARMSRPMQTLLFVGQWLPMKGIRYLREAVTALLREDAGMQVVCAGTLVAADVVRASFPPELSDRIRVLPRVSQSALAELYRDADVFVFPSLYEGFSRAIVEAMASRLPIVSTPVGVAADALRHEQNALLVPKHDSEAIVAAVRRLRQDPSFAERLADAAAETARDYADTVVLDRTMRVIVDAARQPS
jgi:glycosyltransferase involved in cell wall biosynthesis